MTKHREVNKFRGKEKCKMAALIRQANGQQARYIYIIKKKKAKKKSRKNAWWKRRGKERKNRTKTLSEKKEEARNVSKQRAKGWIHVIRVHDTINPFSRQHGRATDAHELPHTKKE